MFPTDLLQGGVYATEKRRASSARATAASETTKETSCVLLDSVQSQANRLEMALLDAFRAGRMKFPLLSVDFSKSVPDIAEITALDAPHRIADAVFRDSILNGRAFPAPTEGRW